MKTCVIFCAGGFSALAEPIDEEDLVIAADGGLRHAEQCGVRPTLILGDFDSLGYTPDRAEVFPVEKDDTDSMLAIKEGLRRGFRRFALYGALDGARLDHTIANLQGLQYLADHGATGYLVGLREIATVIKGEKITFPSSAAGILSLFCLGPTATGVDISGLHYPLENGQLTSGFPLGVSNHFEGEKSEISVKNGSLVMIYGRENGFPVREGIQ